MTDPIDDALDSASPVFDSPLFQATWKELPPGYASGAVNNLDSLMRLDDRIGPGGYEVSQSFIDGMPDSVTMTSGNDGFGTLGADLIGTTAHTAVDWFLRTSGTGSGTAASVTVADPAGSRFGDYQMVGIVVNSTGAVLDVNTDPYDQFGWTRLSEVIDGTIKLVVFGRRWYTAAPNLSLTFAASVAYSWVSVGALAEVAANGTWVDLKPGVPVTLAESVSGTAHALPSVDLPGRGWMFSFWGTVAAAGALAPGGTDVELGESLTATLNISANRSAVQETKRPYLATATTAVATATLAAVGIPLYALDRPEMTAGAYFSPYRRDSPIYGFNRDTADVTLKPRVVTVDGAAATTVFTGAMSDIKVSSGSGTAGLEAYSKTRVLMDRARTPPYIWGRREGLTVDWFANWLMANGSQSVGPGADERTRLLVPFYGSTRPYSQGFTDWDDSIRWRSTDPGTQERHFYPTDVEGPFVSGMYAAWTNAESQEISISFDRYPGKPTIPGVDTPLYNDFMSKRNSIGRMSVWIRCDPFVTAAIPTALAGDATRTWLFKYELSAQSRILNDGVNAGGFYIYIDPSTGTGGARPVIGMGTGDGYQSFALTGLSWPSDGEWHFLSCVYDFATGQVKTRFDSTTWNSTGFTTSAGPAKFDNLYDTEDDIYNGGGYVYNKVWSHLPVADFQVETGPDLYAESWAKFWPKPDPSALYRRTGQWMEALAEATPVAGWDTLLELGQATASMVRCNELDRIEFLPLTYFGETEQLETEAVADTTINASALDVKVDPSKSRNVVTVNFADTTTDSVRGEVLNMKNSLLIRPGVHYITFALDRACLELHGASSPVTGTLFDIVALTAAQIATPSTIPSGRHYMTLSTKADGSGTVPPASYVTGRVVGQPDAYSVTVKITNKQRGNYYLANNGTDVAFLMVLGYGMKVSESFATTRDESSIRIRSERTLDHSSRWVNRRTEAAQLGGTIGNMISVPRGEVTVTVMGNPLRKPGQLVEIVDSEGTQTEGTWRILGITHEGNGPRYTQKLQLVRVGSVMIWDGEPGWNLGVWGE